MACMLRSGRSQPSSQTRTGVDAIIVGSGINSLVCAALLARAGRRVRVLEREAVLGGCIRTDELTLPGFRHDTLSTAHPLFLVGPGFERTSAEMEAAEKNAVSHRARAGEQLAAWLREGGLGG